MHWGWTISSSELGTPENADTSELNKKAVKAV